MYGNNAAGGFPCLWAVMQPAAAGAPDLVQDIRHCIGEDARVLDRSSETLAAARRRRRENLQELRVQSEVWARQMFAQKASENAQVLVLIFAWGWAKERQQVDCTSWIAYSSHL